MVALRPITTREIPVPAGCLHLLRRCRRPLIAVAVALVWLQSVVAGVAAARAFSLADALAGQSVFTLGIICHGAGTVAEDDVAESGLAVQAGAGDPSSDTARHQNWNLCCTSCIATPAAVLAAAVLMSEPVAHHVGRWTAPFDGQAVIVPRRAIRAGPSQAPPFAA
jgi:hypothetical protein